MEVKVVPMFEPRVRGYMRSMVMAPIPTRGVRVEVNMLDDCTSMVRTAPIKMATYPVRCLAGPVVDNRVIVDNMVKVR